MSWLVVRLVLAAVVTVALTACGGGGDSTPPRPNSAPAATAGAAQTVLAGTLVQVSGSGTDADGDPIAYAWSVASKPDGSAIGTSALVTATADKTSFVPDVPGVYVLSLVVSDGKLSSPPALVTITAQGVDDLGIGVDKAEPLAGAATLTLTGPVAGLQVAWYADLKQVGTGTSVAWDTSTAGNGVRQVMARVQLAGTRTVDVKRNLTVANASFTTLAANVSGTSGSIIVTVFAQSPIGTASVTASVDGAFLGTLTAPNACFGCSPPYRDYQFIVDGRALGSGAHAMKVVAVDSQGLSKELAVDLNIANTPQLSISGPMDGSFVYDKISVAGQVSSDRPGAVNVDVKLGDLSIIQGTAPAFSGSYDVSGLAPGPYTVTVKATDSAGVSTIEQRQIVKASSAALAYAPVRSLGADARLLAVEGDRVLYIAGDKSLHLLDTAAGTELALQVGALKAPDGQGLISGGRVYVNATDGRCPNGCLYQWDSNGVVKDVAIGNPWSQSQPPQNPIARSGYVLWANGAYSLTLYDVAAGTYRQIKPDPAVSMGNVHFDMAMVGGALNVFYWGDSGDVSKSLDVYRWSAATGTAVNLSAGGQKDFYVSSDGTRVAWLQSPLSGTDKRTVVSASAAGGPVSVVSAESAAEYVSLKDGVLVWMEASSGNSFAIKASTTTGTSTLTTSAIFRPLGNEAGYVFYGAGGRTYYWNAQLNQSFVVVDGEVPAADVLATGKTLYFLSGTTKLLYKARAN
ncbi:Ig-like domain-containing protein [Roseateles sp.]|uniref:Ig-like domain-containing protein n=1 Tax=Roseateles sp. TaxID=1971397 RepID=UPI0039EB59BB